MPVDTTVNFTGIKFDNPFLLSSAPPTESENNIRRAFDAGWGGVHRAYRTSVHTAWNASFRPIFFPSAYVRPLYEIGTS